MPPALAFIGPIIAGIGGAINAGAAAEAAGQQERAFDERSLEVMKLLEGSKSKIHQTQHKNRLLFQDAGDAAQSGIQQGSLAAQGTLQGGLQTAQGQLGTAFGNAQGALSQGFGAATTQVGQGFQQGAADIRQGGLQAGQALSQLANIGPAQTAQVQGSSNVQNLLNDPTSFQASPGFQFRQQQGERALAAASSAQGGRSGGRALKALAEFNQNLASNEFQASFQRAAQADAQANQLSLANAAAQNQAAFQAQGLQAQGLSGQANLAQSQGQQLAGLAAQGATTLGNISVAQGQGQAGLHTQLGQLQSANTLGVIGQQAGIQTQTADQIANIGLNTAQNVVGANNLEQNQQLNITEAQGNLLLGKVNFAGKGLEAAVNAHGSALNAAVTGTGAIPGGGT